MKHGSNDERKRTREAGTQKGVRRNRASSVLSERVDEVVERSLEDVDKALANHEEADDRNDPVDVGRGCPAHEEEARCEDDRAEHHGWESSFWYSVVTCCVVDFVVVALAIDGVDGAADK